LGISSVRKREREKVQRRASAEHHRRVAAGLIGERYPDGLELVFELQYEDPDGSAINPSYQNLARGEKSGDREPRHCSHSRALRTASASTAVSTLPALLTVCYALGNLSIRPVFHAKGGRTGNGLGYIDAFVP
jgi:hypothetical protein